MNKGFGESGVVAEETQDEGYEGASARLDRAMQRLDASVRSLNGRMRSHSRIEADTNKLLGERAKFANELDKMTARAKRLDDGAQEVSRRLVDAMETVRAVLAK
jgi:ABC-type transporter Mla subunit MlaD